VHIALDGRHHDFPGRLALSARADLRFHKGDQVGHRLLHDPRGLDDLRQEHLALAEQVSHHIHPGHQRPLDDMKRARGSEPSLFGVLDDEVRDSVDECVFQPLRDRRLAPGKVDLCLFALLAAVALSNFKKPVRRVPAPIEQHIFDGIAQLAVDVLINRQATGVDDPHIHPRRDGVIEKYRVHRLPHQLVAAERKRKIRHAAGHMRVGEYFLDPPRRLDKSDTVFGVLLDPGRHRKNVRIEDDVLRREIDLFGQEFVGAFANLDLALRGIRLPGLVECHDDDRGAVTQHLLRLLQKRPFAFLEADRVDDALALDAFEARLDHAPFGAVDHHRHFRDRWFGSEQIQEPHHRGLGIEHALVHVHVEDLRAVLNLIARDVERFVIALVDDEFLEFRRTRDIGALADIDEIC